MVSTKEKKCFQMLRKKLKIYIYWKPYSTSNSICERLKIRSIEVLINRHVKCMCQNMYKTLSKMKFNCNVFKHFSICKLNDSIHSKNIHVKYL